MADQREIDAGALTLGDFNAWERGTVHTLHYNDENRGTLLWIHDSVDWGTRRAVGQFAYEGGTFTEVSDYLYEFDGYVCSGSGAEAMCATMPEDREYDW